MKPGTCLLLALTACVPGLHSNAPRPVTLPFSETISLSASGTGREYQILVALPERYDPDGAPYPVLYAADANAEFFTLVEAARLAAFGGEISDIVIVGIGYDLGEQGIAAMMGPRMLDLTPTRDTAYERRGTAAARAGGYTAPDRTGGAADFMAFIRDDLIPAMEQRYNVSSTDRGWFGHSAGGLFGAYAMLSGNGLFQRLLLGSPYLIWDGRTMFAAESTYASRNRALPARVFFAAGAAEPASMVNTLRAFVDQLGERGYEGFEHTVVLFADERHDPVIPATISRGIRYLYKRDDRR